MHKIAIKPLSVNQAWKGRRYKTPAYKAYEAQALMMLTPGLELPDGPLAINLTFGLSNKNADIDNPVKLFLDCLQKKYGFNDRRIYKMVVEKIDVNKGDEFIKFDIFGMQNNGCRFQA